MTEVVVVSPAPGGDGTLPPQTENPGVTTTIVEAATVAAVAANDAKHTAAAIAETVEEVQRTADSAKWNAEWAETVVSEVRETIGRIETRLYALENPEPGEPSAAGTGTEPVTVVEPVVINEEEIPAKRSALSRWFFGR